LRTSTGTFRARLAWRLAWVAGLDHA